MKIGMAFFLIFFAALTVRAASIFSSEFDDLDQVQISVPGPNAEKSLQAVADDLKSVFERFQPGLDSSSRIVKPVQVGGTQQAPVLKVSIEKCKFVICKTVDLDAEITLREARGSCRRNLVLQADVRRSSAILADVYDHFEVAICFQSRADGSGSLQMVGRAHQAANYSPGLVQGEILDFLKLQVKPITRALKDSMSIPAP